MAPFNPQVNPTQDPNWTGVSRPISDVTPDKSKAIAIAATGEVLNSTVKAADTLTKQSIDTQTDEGVNKLRDAYTESLQAYRNIQIGAADATNTSLVSDTETPPPPGLQSGLNRVQQIGTALAQNGSKINDTLYTGALNSLAKQLRSSYPGYRDYIDEKIKSVSGVDPANAFMKNLLEDINRNSEANKTELNATMSSLRSNADAGFHDKNGVSAANVMTLVRQGIWTPDKAMTWLNSAKSLEYDIKQKGIARTDRQADEADAAQGAVRDAGSIATNIINQGWNTLRLGKGTETFAGMAKFLQENAGRTDITDEEARQRGQMMQSLRDSMYASAWSEAQKQGLLGKGGENAAKVKEALDARFTPLDMAVKSVFNKDWGPAYSHMNFNEAISSDSLHLLNNATDDEVRKYNRMSLAIGKTSPQAAAQFFQSSVLGGVPKAEKEYLKNMKLEMLTQPDEPNGLLSSAQGQINKMKQKGAKSPKTYDDFINTVKDIANPEWNIENRINLARGFFDPEANHGLLSDKNFQRDTVVNGRQIPGKYSVYTRLSTPEISNAIKEIGRTRPDIAKDYEVMMTREFGEQLYGRELNDLRDLNQTFQATKDRPGFQIKVTNDGKSPVRMEMVTDRGEPVPYDRAVAYGAGNAYQAINRLNGGLAGLFNVYSATGPDAGQRTMDTLYRYGYQNANPISDAVTTTIRHDALERMKKKDGSRTE